MWLALNTKLNFKPPAFPGAKEGVLIPPPPTPPLACPWFAFMLQAGTSTPSGACSSSGNGADPPPAQSMTCEVTPQVQDSPEQHLETCDCTAQCCANTVSQCLHGLRRQLTLLMHCHSMDDAFSSAPQLAPDLCTHCMVLLV